VAERITEIIEAEPEQWFPPRALEHLIGQPIPITVESHGTVTGTVVAADVTAGGTRARITVEMPDGSPRGRRSLPVNLGRVGTGG
jgi:hypothetical protein